jgi:hypothetical protein
MAAIGRIYSFAVFSFVLIGVNFSADSGAGDQGSGVPYRQGFEH